MGASILNVQLTDILLFNLNGLQTTMWKDLCYRLNRWSFHHLQICLWLTKHTGCVRSAARLVVTHTIQLSKEFQKVQNVHIVCRRLIMSPPTLSWNLSICQLLSDVKEEICLMCLNPFEICGCVLFSGFTSMAFCSTHYPSQTDNLKCVSYGPIF